MGSPLGPAFTNVFLYYHEKFLLQNCPSEFNLLSIEYALMRYSYFFAGNATSKYSEII